MSKPDKQEEKLNQELERLAENRRKRFTTALGEDCKHINSLIEANYVTPWDVENLIKKGCPLELVSQILL